MLPVKTSFKTSGFGVGKRELIIIGASFALLLLIFAVPFAALFLRIVTGFGVMAGGVLLAFWRVRKTWTLEAWLMAALRFSLRTRTLAKGSREVGQAGESRRRSGPGRGVPLPEHSPLKRFDTQPIFRLPTWLSPRSNGELVGYVLCFSALAILLTWFGTSGVAKMQREILTVLHFLHISSVQ